MFIFVVMLIVPLEFVESTPIEYILTVPAIWSDKAKSDTLWCASKAGFGAMDKIRLITEPEAAAVYTFTTVRKPEAQADKFGTVIEISQLPDYALQKGDVFITCDAGGGTVVSLIYDVIAYMLLIQIGFDDV
jgi:molecular chaperone DnaK (HSP70)